MVWAMFFLFAIAARLTAKYDGMAFFEKKMALTVGRRATVGSVRMATSFYLRGAYSCAVLLGSLRIWLGVPKLGVDLNQVKYAANAISW